MTLRLSVRATRGIALGLVSFAAVGLAARAHAATSTAIKLCKTIGIQTNTRTFRTDVQNQVQTCLRKVTNGTLPNSTNCAADLLTELNGTVTTTYNGRAYKKLVRMEKTLLKKCSGEDKKVDTIDDVIPADLDDAAASFRLHGWGAQLDQEMNTGIDTYATDLRQKGLDVTALTGGASGTEGLLEEDCVSTDPPAVWMAKPPLVRLLHSYVCLMLNAAVAQLQEESYIPAPAVTLIKSRIVGVGSAGLNVHYDAGANLLPPNFPPIFFGDSINETPNIPPFFVGCPSPGIGLCASGGQPCTLPPGLTVGTNPICGITPLPPTYPSDRYCVTGLLGPDGYSNADVPTKTLDDGKCIFKLSPAGATSAAEIKCMVGGVKDGGFPVTTDSSGTCNAGPFATQSCQSNADCDTQIPARYFCISGDEYGCEVDGISGSNRDGAPTCGPCLLAKVAGSPGAGCGVAQSASCILGTCTGGSIRDGQACDNVSINCPGGTCAGIGAGVSLTGDEVGTYSPVRSGMVYFLCPALLRFDLPMEVSNGSGWIVNDLSAAEGALCMPSGTVMRAGGCFVHEPTTASDTSVVGFYTRPSGGYAALPCPDVSLPLRQVDTGLHSGTYLGPVIGVTGVSAQ